SSVRPLPKVIEFLRSSTGWKTASCVSVPSDSVSRQGLVTPLLLCLLLMTLACNRKSRSCSSVNFGSVSGLSEASTKPVRLKQNSASVATAVDRKLRVNIDPLPSRRRVDVHDLYSQDP